MRSLEQVRKRFVIVVTVLGIINLGLLGYILRPGSGITSRHNREADLEQQSRNLKREVSMLKSGNPEKTRADLAKLNEEHIPDRYSEISEELQKLNQQAGVKSQGLRYTQDTTELPGVQRLKIDTTVSGDYEKIVNFINAIERDKLLFIITQIQLSSQQGGLVSLQIKFETFLKQTA